MVDFPSYPSELFGEEKLSWELTGQIMSGGLTASGMDVRARLDGGGRWRAVITGVGFWTAAQRKTWRALQTIMDGGIQPIITPVRETIDAP